MKKLYAVTPPIPGYGTRIWVNKEQAIEAGLIPLFKPWCMWGGYDKDDGHTIAWEFSRSAYLQIVEVLVGKGFQKASNMEVGAICTVGA